MPESQHLPRAGPPRRRSHFFPREFRHRGRLASPTPPTPSGRVNLAGAHARVAIFTNRRGVSTPLWPLSMNSHPPPSVSPQPTPLNAGWQQQLALAYVKVGDVYKAQGRLDDALAAFREYLAISERLASSDPSNAGWQFGFGVAYSESATSTKSGVASMTLWPLFVNTSRSSGASPQSIPPMPAGGANSPSRIPKLAISTRRKVASKRLGRFS